MIREFIDEVFLPMSLKSSAEFRQSVLSQVSVSVKLDRNEFIQRVTHFGSWVFNP